MRMRRKPNLAARLEKCSYLLVKEPKLLHGGWLDEFKYKELHIELGCGKGKFTVESAKARPDVLFVALEKTANVIVIALERVAAEGLQNVRFINNLADFLTGYFAPNEVAQIYINFCDPWPNSKQAKRRLTGQLFLELYKQVLPTGGEIHFKTDNLPLFEFSLREFERHGFSLQEVTHNLHKNTPVGVMTDYEQKFHEQGIPICKCVAVKQGV